jgi:hypothetical protein
MLTWWLGCTRNETTALRCRLYCFVYRLFVDRTEGKTYLTMPALLEGEGGAFHLVRDICETTII